MNRKEQKEMKDSVRAGARNLQKIVKAHKMSIVIVDACGVEKTNVKKKEKQ